MTASMVGSALSSILMRRYRVETYMKYVFALSAVAMAVPFLFHYERAPANNKTDLAAGSAAVADGLSLEGQIQLVAFCAFEVRPLRARLSR